MSLDYIAIVALSAFSSASVLIIATLGLAVVFGLMGVINLAHGEFIMFGAYVTLFAVKAGIPFPVAVCVATLSTALFGAIVECLIIRRLYGRLFDTMLATWGLSMVMYQGAVLMFGSVTEGIGMPVSNVSIGQYSISSYMLFLIVVAVVITLMTYALLTKTNYGVMARASIQDGQMAKAVGIESKHVNTMTFSLGAALAGFAGAILVPAIPATPTMGFAFVIKAFLIVVAAGPVTLTGSVIAGGGLGVITNAISSFWSTAFGDIVFFFITICVLRYFPRGISEKWRMKL
ncbi:MAG: branched-chain amino acid ABC transporter permease [Arenicella sp.]